MSVLQLLEKRENPKELSVRLAGKLVAFILLLTLIMGVLVSGVGKAFATTMSHASSKIPAPKMDVMVKGEHVRLGDVFENLPQNADFVLAPAPAPGQELVWNAPTLLRIATAFNLDWRPGDNTEVRIRRAASLVDGNTMKAIIRDHLASLNANDIYNIRLTSAAADIVVPGKLAPDLRIADFNMQPTGGTFSAIIRITAANGWQENVTLRGVAERMLRLPVLKTSLRNGDIIRESDIAWTTQKASLTRGDLATDPSSLIGATPRRTLAAGEAIRLDAVQLPRLVNNGDIVTMVYNHNGMYLTARGRALEDGAAGDVVRVSNTGSSRTVQARVTAHKEVTVN